MAHNRRYTKDEVEAAFHKMPTFSYDSIDVADMDAFLATLGYDCTQEQMDAYVKFISEMHNGKLTFDLCIPALGVINDMKEFVRVHVTAVDKDHDGFIDESEFKEILSFLLKHDPSYPRIEFDDFLKEVDTTKDRIVSVDEAVEWFCKNAKN